MDPTKSGKSFEVQVRSAFCETIMRDVVRVDRVTPRIGLQNKMDGSTVLDTFFLHSD
jgi:hypothetical protein